MSPMKRPEILLGIVKLARFIGKVSESQLLSYFFFGFLMRADFTKVFKLLLRPVK